MQVFEADEIVTARPPTPGEDCAVAIRVGRRSFVKRSVLEQKISAVQVGGGPFRDTHL